MRLLLIEDEPDLSAVIAQALREQEFAVDVAADGTEGLSKALLNDYDAIILDLMLPGMHGLDVLQNLRQEKKTPVLILTARDETIDKIRGLNQGADDFVTKPFDLGELLARIRVRLRRLAPAENPSWRVGDLILYIESRRVFRAGQEIALTPREFELLLYLVQRQPGVVTRATLSTDVWRAARSSPSLDNSIDVHVTRLRRKIDAGHPTRLIHTIRGEGFAVSESTPPGSVTTRNPWTGQG